MQVSGDERWSGGKEQSRLSNSGRVHLHSSGSRGVEKLNQDEGEHRKRATSGRRSLKASYEC